MLSGAGNLKHIPVALKALVFVALWQKRRWTLPWDTEKLPLAIIVNIWHFADCVVNLFLIFFGGGSDNCEDLTMLIVRTFYTFCVCLSDVLSSFQSGRAKRLTQSCIGKLYWIPSVIDTDRLMFLGYSEGICLCRSCGMARIRDGTTEQHHALFSSYSNPLPLVTTTIFQHGFKRSSTDNLHVHDWSKQS